MLWRKDIERKKKIESDSYRFTKGTSNSKPMGNKKACLELSRLFKER